MRRAFRDEFSGIQARFWRLCSVSDWSGGDVYIACILNKFTYFYLFHGPRQLKVTLDGGHNVDEEVGNDGDEDVTEVPAKAAFCKAQDPGPHGSSGSQISRQEVGFNV